MAKTVAEFLKNDRYREWKLVVLAGGFHVQYGFGIPKRAFRRAPHAYSIILPTVTHIPPALENRKMKVKEVSIPLLSADFAWKLPYKVLPSNPIRLGVLLKELEKGVLVKMVGDNSNAKRAGIQENDVLVQIDGQEIADAEDIIERLRTKNFGDRATIKLLRDNKEMDVEVVLQKSPR
ncbi:MAG: PDZ domain-containing protein [Nitrospinales bacterium]